jgi:hypothetical protein
MKKFLFDVLNYNFLKPKYCKKTLFFSKSRFFRITTKSQKNSGIFCQIAEFYGGIGGQI